MTGLFRVPAIRLRCFDLQGETGPPWHSCDVLLLGFRTLGMLLTSAAIGSSNAHPRATCGSREGPLGHRTLTSLGLAESCNGGVLRCVHGLTSIFEAIHAVAPLIRGRMWPPRRSLKNNAVQALLASGSRTRGTSCFSTTTKRYMCA